MHYFLFALRHSLPSSHFPFKKIHLGLSLSENSCSDVLLYYYQFYRCYYSLELCCLSSCIHLTVVKDLPDCSSFHAYGWYVRNSESSVVLFNSLFLKSTKIESPDVCNIFSERWYSIVGRTVEKLEVDAVEMVYFTSVPSFQ